MSDQAPSENTPTDRVRDYAARLLAENPGLTREQLRAALVNAFLPPNGCPATADIIFRMAHVGLLHLAYFYYLRWAFRRDKSAVEAVKAEINEIVAEFTTVR